MGCVVVIVIAIVLIVVLEIATRDPSGGLFTDILAITVGISLIGSIGLLILFGLVRAIWDEHEQDAIIEGTFDVVARVWYGFAFLLRAVIRLCYRVAGHDLYDVIEEDEYKLLLAKCNEHYLELSPSICAFCSREQVEALLRTFLKAGESPQQCVYYVHQTLLRLLERGEIQALYDKHAEALKHVWPRDDFQQQLDASLPEDILEGARLNDAAWFRNQITRLAPPQRTRKLAVVRDDARVSQLKAKHAQSQADADRARRQRDALAERLKQRLAEVREIIEEANRSSGRSRDPLLKQLQQEEAELLKALKNV